MGQVKLSIYYILYHFWGNMMIHIFPTKLKTIIKLYFYSFNFFKIMLVNILMTTFLTIKKTEINKMNLKIIRPPIMH